MNENRDNNIGGAGGPDWTPETKSQFIDAIVKGFDGFVKTFRKNGLLFCFLILLLFMLLYSFVLSPIRIGEIVEKLMDAQRKEKVEDIERHVQQRMEADRLMLNIMNSITEDYDVDRCMVFEAHNSTNNLSQVPFLYLTCSSEILAGDTTNGEDIDYISDSFSHQMISNFIGSITWNRLKHEKYLSFNHLENYKRNTYRFINKMRDFGAHSLMIIPFVSSNVPLVLLVVSSRAETIPAEKIYAFVEKFRPEIEKNLMAG